MSVRTLLKTKPAGVTTVDSAADVGAAARLLRDNAIGGLPVVDQDGSLVGFLSEREIVEAVLRHSPFVSDVGVPSIMRRPAPICRSDDPIRDVMERMTQDRLRHLVVMEGDRIAGVISVGDIVKYRLQELETETGVLRDYVAAQRALR